MLGRWSPLEPKVNVNELFQRLARIETETAIARRKRQEEADKVVQALAQLSEGDVEILARLYPEFVAIKDFTAQDLVNNAHGELDRVQRLFYTAAAALDKRLQYFEEAL